MNEQQLSAWITEVIGGPAPTLERVGYGASRATYLVGDLVARVDTGDGPMAGTELSLHREAVVYQALADSPVRIPSLRAESSDGTVLLIERASGTHELIGLDDAARAKVDRAQFGLDQTQQKR